MQPAATAHHEVRSRRQDSLVELGASSWGPPVQRSSNLSWPSVGVYSEWELGRLHCHSQSTGVWACPVVCFPSALLPEPS